MASYDVEGYLLEACSCAPPCPCWIGDDADGGKCDAFNGYRIQKGSIKGIDVAGATFAFAIHIPGNVLRTYPNTPARRQQMIAQANVRSAV